MTKVVVLVATAAIMSCSGVMTKGAQAGFDDRMKIDPLAKPTFPAETSPQVPSQTMQKASEFETAARPSRRSGRERAAHRSRHGGQAGLATWYGPGFYGHRTASGERFSGDAMTAAHRSLPFGTKVQVVDEHSGRSVVVRINDRGPYRRGAIIDLSRASARALGVSGTAHVRLVSLSQ